MKECGACVFRTQLVWVENKVQLWVNWARARDAITPRSVFSISIMKTKLLRNLMGRRARGGACVERRSVGGVYRPHKALVYTPTCVFSGRATLPLSLQPSPPSRAHTAHHQLSLRAIRVSIAAPASGSFALVPVGE